MLNFLSTFWSFTVTSQKKHNVIIYKKRASIVFARPTKQRYQRKILAPSLGTPMNRVTVQHATTTSNRA